MNLKSYIIGVAIGAIVIGGVCVYTANYLRNEEKELMSINSEVKESSNIKEEIKIIDLISSQKVYSETYKVECYEVVLKNTSGQNLKRVEISLGDRNI